MAEPGFNEGRRDFLRGGVAALAGIGAELISLRSADAKETRKKRGPKDRPRAHRAPDELDRVVHEVEKLTHAYVDTLEDYLKHTPPINLAVAVKVAKLTQVHLKALALLARGEEYATPTLDAHNLHYAVRDALVRKRHNPLVANAIDNMWSTISVIAVEQSHPGEDPGIVPPGTDA